MRPEEEDTLLLLTPRPSRPRPTPTAQICSRLFFLGPQAAGFTGSLLQKREVATCALEPDLFSQNSYPQKFFAPWPKAC